MNEAELRVAYESYVTHVSSPEMAISWELARWLWIFVHEEKPATVIDLGSGFSTFVFAQARRDLGFQLESFDDDPGWARATEDLVEGEVDVYVRQVEDVCERLARGVDKNALVFVDFGRSLQDRLLIIDAAIDGGARWIVVDDLHYAAFDGVRQSPLLTSLHDKTIDSFGRYAGLLVNER